MLRRNGRKLLMNECVHSSADCRYFMLLIRSMNASIRGRTTCFVFRILYTAINNEAKTSAALKLLMNDINRNSAGKQKVYD